LSSTRPVAAPWHDVQAALPSVDSSAYPPALLQMASAEELLGLEHRAAANSSRSNDRVIRLQISHVLLFTTIFTTIDVALVPWSALRYKTCVAA